MPRPPRRGRRVPAGHSGAWPAYLAVALLVILVLAVLLGRSLRPPAPPRVPPGGVYWSRQHRSVLAPLAVGELLMAAPERSLAALIRESWAPGAPHKWRAVLRRLLLDEVVAGLGIARASLSKVAYVWAHPRDGLARRLRIIGGDGDRRLAVGGEGDLIGNRGHHSLTPFPLI